MPTLRKEHYHLTPNQRLLSFSKPIIALTGGIASGKSTVSTHLQERGIQVVCADKIIKDIYKEQATVEFISKIAPTCMNGAAIDFGKLRKIFFSNRDLKSKIEHYLFNLYPDFLQQSFNKVETQDFILYDVPLLFEKSLQKGVDQTICVYTTSSMQIQRVQKRDGSTIEVAQSIINAQMSLENKKELSNFVINNVKDLTYLKKQTDDLISLLFVIE